MSAPDRYNLQRFIDAQLPVYESVLDELRGGRKTSHWMWFVFPQLQGLGRSTTARKFAITGRGEASAYAEHQLLGHRLRECTQLTLDITHRSALEIFGSIDEIKFRSCMTLFKLCAPDNALFSEALYKYFNGQPDQVTEGLLD